MNIHQHIFIEVRELSQRLTLIREKLEKQDITPQKREELHQELHSVQSHLESLKGSAFELEARIESTFMAFFPLSRFEELQEEIAKFTHAIEEGFDKYQISVIGKKALEVGSTAKSRPLSSLARKVDSLKGSIKVLLHHRCPSMQHRKVIFYARKIAAKASEVIEKKIHPKSKEHLQALEVLNVLLQEALAKAELDLNPQEAELAMELTEIADFLRINKIEEGRLRLRLILPRLNSQDQKKIKEVESSLDTLVPTLLEVAGAESTIDWQGLTAATKRIKRAKIFSFNPAALPA